MNKITIINGSASSDSSNERLVEHIAGLLRGEFEVTVYDKLKTLPHFDPQLSLDDPPGEVIELRRLVDESKGVVICTPEYVFSIPSGLKNAIEWCVATTVFSDKPVGLVTASAEGTKGHEQLMMVMRTLGAEFNDRATLLVQSVKAKIQKNGTISDSSLVRELNGFVAAFKKSVSTETAPQ